MYIVIVGLGGIGRNLARQSVEHAHTVVVIDQDEARCSELLEHYDVMAVTGNATDKTTLEEAGIEVIELLQTSASTRQTADLLAGVLRYLDYSSAANRLSA